MPTWFMVADMRLRVPLVSERGRQCCPAGAMVLAAYDRPMDFRAKDEYRMNAYKQRACGSRNYATGFAPRSDRLKMT